MSDSETHPGSPVPAHEDAARTSPHAPADAGGAAEGRRDLAEAAGQVESASASESDHGHAGDSAIATGVTAPTMVRRVVCSYQLGWLPGDWLQTWRRLDRVFARAGLRVKATLAPLEDLPEDTDILVVPPDLRDAAKNAARPGTPILVTSASAAAGAFAELVTRLEAGTQFTADKVTPEDGEAPKLVSYRGHTILD